MKKGLYTDGVKQHQPEETYSYALNSIMNREGFIESEESNEVYQNLPDGYVPLGSVYVDDGETVIFASNTAETNSRILIVKDGGITTSVSYDLGFKLNYSIDATYRLRRGCEKVIYFVDGYNEDRYFNISKPEDFQDSGGNWELNKFKLTPDIEEHTLIIPSVGNTGNIKTGSYNFHVQYLDNNLNPTEFIASTPIIKIYKDGLQKDYRDVMGSKEGTPTNKSILLSLLNIDTSFPYYRYSVTEASTGNGLVSKTYLTDKIPTGVNSYVFTGKSFGDLLPQDVAKSKTVVKASKTITQYENRLVRVGFKGDNTDYCELQRYASAITTDVLLHSISQETRDNNSKDFFDSSYYMPGEIYSFGIVYVFSDNTYSPVYHIPGKNNTLSSSHVFSAGSGVYGMRSTNNTISINYLDNGDPNRDYWGKDSEGTSLLNTSVRHHRFPTRRELMDGGATQADVSMFADDNSSSPTTKNKSKVFKLKVSNVVLPPASVTNGKTVTNYFIVRQKRTEADKTIVGSGVLLPILKSVAGSTDNYKAHGLLMPETTWDSWSLGEGAGASTMNSDSAAHKAQLSKTDFAFINIEHKFDKKEMDSITSITSEGGFGYTAGVNNHALKLAEFDVQDTVPGSSWETGYGDEDTDGWTLRCLTRTVPLEYRTSTSAVTQNFTDKATADIKKISYLDSYDFENVDALKIYNLAADNSIGILQTNSVDTGYDFDYGAASSIVYPYVYFRKENSSPYANYRNSQYIRVTTDRSLSTAFVGEGDIYTDPVDYASTTFINNKVAMRVKDFDFLDVFNKALLGLWTVSPSKILEAVTDVVSYKKWSDVYLSEYSKGLESAVTDRFIAEQFLYYGDLPGIQYPNNSGSSSGDTYSVFGPEDDTIQYIGEVLQHLCFESTINVGLRYSEEEFFMPPIHYTPAAPNLKTNVDTVTITPSGFGASIALLEDKTIAPIDDITSYFKKKLLFNSSLYKDPVFILPIQEDYKYNKDFMRRDTQKPHFPLGLEYDCCSECRESFPDRITWSNVSFSEELSDNYKVTLPNNYKDFNNGKIVNIDVFNDNLLIHTDNMLYIQPKNLQEKIIGDFVTYLGTGEFLALPAKKVSEVEEYAGLFNREASIKTEYGIFFISHNNGKVFHFDGNKLHILSDFGMKQYFFKEAPLLAKDEYDIASGGLYPFENPSSTYGVGYLGSYDKKNNRIIFSKKDFSLIDSLISSSDYRIIQEAGTIKMFEDYEDTIATRDTAGFYFVGVRDYKMVFRKWNSTTLTEEYELPITVGNIKKYDNSLTASFNLNFNRWVSFHSYLPYFMFFDNNNFYSWKSNFSETLKSRIYSHNKLGEYKTFYGILYPFIIELTKTSPTATVFEGIKYYSQAYEYDPTTEDYMENRFTTFNKVIVYNDSQISGELTITEKNVNTADYLAMSVKGNTNLVAFADKNERDWSLNNLRNYREVYSSPMFLKTLQNRQTNYPIDKEVNTAILNYNLAWNQIEKFRGKYISIRLISSNFANEKIIFTSSENIEEVSKR